METLIPINNRLPEPIRPGERKKIAWDQWCQVFEIGGLKRYFSPTVHVPEAEMFNIPLNEIKLRIIYRDSNLYFDKKSKGLTLIDEVEGDAKECQSHL